MSKKILIIEDEQSIAEVFRDQLTLGGGFEVEIAIGGQAGLDSLAKGKYDLILLDLVMQPIDGLEVLKTIKEDAEKYGQPSVIALTNVTSPEAKEEAKEYGIKDYVVKTEIGAKELIDLVNRVTNE